MAARTNRRSFRRARALLIVAVASAALTAMTAREADACWRPPVRGRVVDPFREPPCPWCAGNRGIEYRVPRRTPVRSVAAGEVTYSGVVAGTRYVVVRLPDGRRITYGRLTASRVRTGDRVLRGTTIGAAGPQFFFGVRVGDRHIDPAPLLGRLVGRPRLVPTDGSPSRTPPPPRLRCGE